MLSQLDYKLLESKDKEPPVYLIPNSVFPTLFAPSTLPGDSRKYPERPKLKLGAEIHTLKKNNGDANLPTSGTKQIFVTRIKPCLTMV